MAWSLSASGHLDTPEAEARFIDALREAIFTSGAGYATLVTSHHGTTNLFAGANTSHFAAEDSSAAEDTEAAPESSFGEEDAATEPTSDSATTAAVTIVTV